MSAAAWHKFSKHAADDRLGLRPASQRNKSGLKGKEATTQHKG